MIKAQIPHHEFWPAWLFYGPVYLDYAIESIKMGSMKYPLIINPMMEMSGFIGEKKYQIIECLPKEVVPETILIDFTKPIEEQFQWREGRIWIAKPNQGERGFGVRKIASSSELAMYHSSAPRDYILQEYVDLPIEFGVFFVRTPGEPLGRITSLCTKDAITVTGDGVRSVRELCQVNPRFEKQIERLGNILSEGKWDVVPADGEAYHLDVIRNHRRGSCFRDARHLITEEMHEAFQKLLPASLGFNYGRIDLRASSIEEFQAGRGFKILEINGVTSEPGEIYDPKMSLQESMAILRMHWNYVAEIGKSRLREAEEIPRVLDIYNMFKEAINRPSFFDR